MQLPLVLVMGSLVSVALLPMMVQGRISASLNEISEVVEPIHRSVDEIQLALEEAQVEAELRRQEVERVSASRERLMRGFSHDVRNPLGAAEGYLWMLEQGVMNPLTSKQSDAVGKSRRSIKAALKIIEDLLELAPGSAGEVELHRGPVDLRAVAIRAAEDYSAQAGSKGLALEWDIPAAFPIVQSDIAKVSEILGNVIGNAVKYTQREASRLASESARTIPGAVGRSWRCRIPVPAFLQTSMS